MTAAFTAKSLTLLIAVTALTAGCSPLKTFNAIIPKDDGGVQIAEAISYRPPDAGPDASADRRALDVFAPKPGIASDISRPVVIFFYGGSWNSGSRTGYDFVGRALAARGFVTIIPDYRLVPQVRYPAFVEDGAAAVRWARAHAADYGGDPDKIVVAGHSAGAYIAAMLAVDDRWLGADRAAVKGFIGLAGPYDFAPFDAGAARNAFGNWPDPAETQPVNWAGAGDPPALLLVGEKDDTVEPRNSEELARRLEQAGVSAEIKRYPRVGHIGIITSIAKPLRDRSSALDDMAVFVERVTRAEP